MPSFFIPHIPQVENVGDHEAYIIPPTRLFRSLLTLTRPLLLSNSPFSCPFLLYYCNRCSFCGSAIHPILSKFIIVSNNVRCVQRMGVFEKHFQLIYLVNRYYLKRATTNMEYETTPKM